jgi:Ca2+-dependent lipid-binding protein
MSSTTTTSLENSSRSDLKSPTNTSLKQTENQKSSDNLEPTRQKSNDSNVSDDLGLQKAPKLNIGAPVSRSIGKKLRKALEDKEAKKRIQHPAAFRGWKEVAGYDESYALSPVDEIMDLLTRATTLEQYLPEYLYGEWYHGIGIILLATICSGLLGKYKFNIGFVFFVAFFAALYYRSSIRKYRLNLRLKAQREFSVHSIEDDFESLDWLNVFLDKYWNFLEPSISQQITEIVNPMLAEMDSIPAFIKEIWIHSITLGTKPLRVDKVRTLDRTANDVTVMDWTVSMIPNAKADVTVKQMKNNVNQQVLLKMKIFSFTISILVSDISFRANARVRLRMMTNFPHIQTINVSLSDTPEFDFIAKPVGGTTIFGFELFAIPGVYLLLREMVKKYLGPLLFQPLSFQLNLEQLLAGNGATGALGVLELNVKNASNLQGADTFNNTIDPYFTFGFSDSVLAKTKVVYDNINPTYNQTLRVILNSSSDPLVIKLYDENESDGRKDKFMGAALFDLEELMSKTEMCNITVPILRNNHPAGCFNFDIKLMKSLQGSQLPDGSYSPPPDYNTGVAKITLLGARSYTANEEEKKSVYAQVYISGEKKIESGVAKNSSEAAWNCCFEDIIYDRSKSKIRIVLKEKSKENKTIGSTTLSLVDIIDASYVGNSWFRLASGIGEVNISCIWNSVKIAGVPGAIGYSEPMGVLRIYIERADELMNLNKLGIIDPYIRVLINGIQRGRTLTVSSTVNPKYYESIYIPISSVNQRITIEAMDVERHTQDRTLGSFQVRLNEFIDYNAKSKPIETIGEMKEARLFHKRKGAKGSVIYSLSFYPVKAVATPCEIETEEAEVKKLQEKIEQEDEKKEEKVNEAALAQINHQDDLKLDLKTKQLLKLEDVPQYNTGVLIVTILESKFSTNGYFQIFFDKKGHAEFEYKFTPTTNIRRTFDYLVKELQKYSVITFRIVEKPNQTLNKKALKEITIPTLSLLENSYGKPTTLRIGDDSNVVKLRSKYLPANITDLPAADSVGNSGMLSIDIVRASGLLSKDSNGKSDPFVKVYLNGEEFYHTKTKKKTLNPEWNENTSVEIDSRVQSVLRFKVNDWDFGVEQDDKIGEYKFALKSLDPFADKMVDYEIPLIADNRSAAGTLFIRLGFKPEYHTLVSADKPLPNPSSLTVDGAGKLLNTGVDGAGKIVGTAGKIGGKALQGAGAIGHMFKRKH